MAIVTINEAYLADIANAIRAKGGTDTYKPKEMAAAINALPTSGGGSGFAYTIHYNTDIIGDYCFYQTPITSITAQADSKLERIGQWAFAQCTNLKTIDLSNATNLLNLYDISPSFKNSYAFYNCTGLTNVILPSTLVTIGDSAFRNCTGLTSIELPESLTTIEDNAFYKAGLTSVTIPASVETIGSTNGCSFYCPNTLRTVTFKGTPNSIHKDTFYGLTGLTINVPWASGAVSGAPWGAINPIINYNYTA